MPSTAAAWMPGAGLRHPFDLGRVWCRVCKTACALAQSRQPQFAARDASHIGRRPGQRTALGETPSARQLAVAVLRLGAREGIDALAQAGLADG